MATMTRGTTPILQFNSDVDLSDLSVAWLTFRQGNRGNWGTTINPGGSVTIPQGYHSGGGVVRANASTFGCERAGACWANGYANGSGSQSSSWATGGQDTYSAWVNAAVSGYFCYWISQGAMAPAEYGYRYFNAGERIVTRGPGSTGCGMVAYIHP